jgi:hypothetical protein
MKQITSKIVKDESQMKILISKANVKKIASIFIGHEKTLFKCQYLNSIPNKSHLSVSNFF